MVIHISEISKPMDQRICLKKVHNPTELVRHSSVKSITYGISQSHHKEISFGPKTNKLIWTIRLIENTQTPKSQATYSHCMHMHVSLKKRHVLSLSFYLFPHSLISLFSSKQRNKNVEKISFGQLSHPVSL